MSEKELKDNGAQVIRGLEGVVAAETDISYVDGANGDLYYKGYNIHDLADTCTYMEVAYLLLNGNLPTEEELQAFRLQTVSEMRLPSQIVKMMEIMPPSSHPMDVLRTVVSALSYFDHDSKSNSPEANRHKAVRLIAQIPTIVAHLFRIRRREMIVSPDPQISMAANILYMFHGAIPSDAHIRAMDQLLLLHADHGMNASTFAARVTASTHADLHAAITSAIGTLSGPL
ncbi:MAG TPA: citrate/2-methylcitrate synthase, partial [Armatimonadota bacterium]|nr:citrate/2-methylcitrate synthase [Armatimonadota bacterium]